MKDAGSLPEWRPANRTLDVTGALCPEPVIKARAELDAMQSGEVLDVRATDPLAALDLAVMCEHLGHRLLASATLDGIVRVQIQCSD